MLHTSPEECIRAELQIAMTGCCSWYTSPFVTQTNLPGHCPGCFILDDHIEWRKDLISYKWSIDRLTPTRSSRPLSHLEASYYTHFPHNVMHLQLSVIYTCALYTIRTINICASLCTLAVLPSKVINSKAAYMEFNILQFSHLSWFFYYNQLIQCNSLDSLLFIYL